MRVGDALQPVQALRQINVEIYVTGSSSRVLSCDLATALRGRSITLEVFPLSFREEETDPDKLHDLKAALDGRRIYSAAQIEELVTQYLGGADRDRLDPILDAVVAGYRER